MALLIELFMSLSFFIAQTSCLHAGRMRARAQGVDYPVGNIEIFIRRALVCIDRQFARGCHSGAGTVTAPWRWMGEGICYPRRLDVKQHFIAAAILALAISGGALAQVSTQTTTTTATPGVAAGSGTSSSSSSSTTTNSDGSKSTTKVETMPIAPNPTGSGVPSVSQSTTTTIKN